MKRPTSTAVLRLLIGLTFFLCLNVADAQFGARRIFERGKTYESQMLKMIGFNPTGKLFAYNAPDRLRSQLDPLETIFGELSLQAAEILAMDLTPGYTADRLINDIGKINEFRGRFNGILCLLIMNVVRHSSDGESNPSIRALSEWSTNMYRSLLIRSANAILVEFQKWKADWCTYEHISPEECQAKTNGIGELFSHRDVPEGLIVKNGMGNVFDKSANSIALGTAFALAGITGTFAVTVTAGALGVATTVATTAGSEVAASTVASSLFAAFGGEGLGASEAAATFATLGGGWSTVVAAPVTAVILAVVVGTIQGFHEVEQAKIEPMMKMKLGSAISDHVNIRNVLSDTAGRSLFFLGFQEAAVNKYALIAPNVDGELRFFCQAGYMTKFNVSYTVTTSGPNMPTTTKNFSTDTKDLSVGNEDYVAIPWNAANIMVKGYYLLGDWKQFTNQDKSASSTSVRIPTYMCFTSYGTVFEPKIKFDCPEVGNMTTHSNELTVTQGGGYVAWITLRYFLNGKEVTLLNQHDVSLGWNKKFTFPAGAKNITLSIQNQVNGFVVFNQTWPEPPNGCVKIYGTTFDPKWNSECN